MAQFDRNDRLLNEMKLFDGVATEKTDYAFNKTEQIAKAVTNLVTGKIESKTSMTYDAQGRMAKIVIESFVNGVQSQVVTQTYAYDSDGIKIRQTETIEGGGTRDTIYLNDKQNHTGYSQVLEERVVENGREVKITAYTIGHDVLAQFTTAIGYLALLTDGHGSTRAATDKRGGNVQQYNYDAYGNALGFKPTDVLTNHLYSGEQFNPVSGLQYLRARWYNPQSGRFNRLDPYSGNQQSPLSFHKYAYVHNNPIIGVDPEGLFFSLSGIVSAMNTIGNIAVRSISIASKAIPYAYTAIKTLYYQYMLPSLFIGAVSFQRIGASALRSIAVTKNGLLVFYQYFQANPHLVIPTSENLIDGVSTAIYRNGPPPATPFGADIYFIIEGYEKISNNIKNILNNRLSDKDLEELKLYKLRDAAVEEQYIRDHYVYMGDLAPGYSIYVNPDMVE